MKIALRILAVLLFFALSLPQGIGQKYSNEFLSIGVSAQAQGLGNAVVSRVNDATSGYWNPAGLANVNNDIGLQVGAMHAEWFAGIGKYDFLGIVLPLSTPNRRLGISVIRFGVDGIPNTLSLYDDEGNVNYDNIVEFSAADYAFLLSYGRRFQTNKGTLNVGGNVKVIHRVIGTFANSWGFGLDLGVQYHIDNWKFGLMARDVTSTFNIWRITFTEEEKNVLIREGNELPDISSMEVTRPQFQLGAGYLFEWNKVTLYPELDFIVTTDGQRNTLITGDPFSIDPAFGIEAGYNNLIYLRAGVNQFQQELDFDRGEFWSMRPSLGVGLKLGSLAVDYAYTDLGDSQNRYSHVISLLLDFKPKGK
jgi:hypothetical protein